MADVTITDYIKILGKQAKNQQKLLSYYGELYEFYNDKLPKNKYIYYLEENPYTEPFSTLSPNTHDFFSMGSKKLSMLTPYIRIFKKFKGKKGKKIEIPFENRTNFDSFDDPVGYVGGATDFTSERFMGPVAGLSSLTISYKGVGGKGAIPRTTHVVTAELTMSLQDVKLLFKNWDTEESVKYKDIFAFPGKRSYYIIFELGYNVPDNFDSGLTRLATSKLVLNMSPNGAKTSITYNIDGSAQLTTQLDGWAENIAEEVNLLNPKYFKQVRQSKNMLLIDNEEDFSVDKYEKQIGNLESLKEAATLKEQQQINQKNPPPKPSSKESTTSGSKTIQKKLDLLRRHVQLAKNAGAVPPVFSFIAALYEAGKIYYIELDNERYQDYIKKIAGDIPIDVSKINVVPKRKQKLRLEPEDFLKKTKDKTDYHAGTLRIRSFNREEASTSKFERVKFFYFGDLINVILNDRRGGGAGQDLDALGSDDFRLLLGPTVWVKNANLRKIYNIANTPISLDMFLFELNKEIYSRNRKSLSMREFFSIFMKRFFDTVVLSAEKEKTGKDQQRYTGKINYIFDKDKIAAADKFLNSLYNYLPERGTRDTLNMLHLTTFLEDKKITQKTKNRRNIPTVYLGGPDKGPLMGIDFKILQLPAEATRQLFKGFAANKGTSDSIGETKDDSVLISARTKATITLKGNPYLNLMDYIFIDTRFVDGGYFQEDSSSILFTGYFVIYSAQHTLKGNVWTSTYEATHIQDYKTPTFAAYSGELPKPQNVSLIDNAKANKAAAGGDVVITTGQNANAKPAPVSGNSSASKPETNDPVVPPAAPYDVPE